MSINIAALIAQYGYIFVFLGALTEGEIIVITAGTFAYYGQLNIFYVILTAFLGTGLSEYISYAIGYKYGDGFLYQLTKIKYINSFINASKIDMILHLIQIKQQMFILFFRFMPGIRTFSPILIGNSKVQPTVFAFYNAIAALLWATINACIGYITTYANLHLGLSNFSHWFMIGIYLVINLTVIPTMLMKLFNIWMKREEQEISTYIN